MKICTTFDAVLYKRPKSIYDIPRPAAVVTPPSPRGVSKKAVIAVYTRGDLAVDLGVFFEHFYF